MQPYIFPYLGYFQLIHAVDTFVFYDDVNFIKKGWINRNRIKVRNEESLFTVPLVKASQNKQINETLVSIDQKWLNQFLRTLELNYKKAAYFDEVFSLIESVIISNKETIAELAAKSITTVTEYLDLKRDFKISSESFSNTKDLGKVERLIAITLQNRSNNYINPSGGKELYSKEQFLSAGIQLNFIKHELKDYPQIGEPMIPGLSIIDVLMHNPKEEVQKLLVNYELI